MGLSWQKEQIDEFFIWTDCKIGQSHFEMTKKEAISIIKREEKDWKVLKHGFIFIKWSVFQIKNNKLWVFGLIGLFDVYFL